MAQSASSRKAEHSSFMSFSALFQQVGCVAVSYNERDLCSYLSLYDLSPTPTHGCNVLPYPAPLAYLISNVHVPSRYILLDFSYTHLLCLNCESSLGGLSIVTPSRRTKNDRQHSLISFIRGPRWSMRIVAVPLT